MRIKFIWVTIERLSIVVKTNSVPYEIYKYSCHAEKDAFLKIKKVRQKGLKGLKNAKIYIGRIIDGKLCTAEPCHLCSKLLVKYGAKKVMKI